MFEVKINRDYIVQKMSGALVRDDVEREIVAFLNANDILYDRRLIYHNTIDYKFRYDILYLFASENDAAQFALMWG